MNRSYRSFIPRRTELDWFMFLHENRHMEWVGMAVISSL